jgi:class 3 adenylate cyclase/predicted ATPase
MFCDVVDSTTFAGQLDPEDFRAMMERYHTTCTTVSERYGGHVAQYMGDGLLVYFGWPQAHEDDARRAVHAGMALVTAIRDLGRELLQDFGIRLAIRVGIHTGLVVVGAETGASPYGQLAVGVTPHLAAKIQHLAAPDAVVLSATTYDLVQGYFVCAPLGEHHLPGTTAPGVLYQVRGVSGAHGRLDLVAPPQRSPFVGREVERAMLRERATQVQQGLGQVVLLSGEAGIGKSRLVQEVTTACEAEDFAYLDCRCSPYAQHTALHPVIAWLQRSIEDDAETPMAERLVRLEAFVGQAGLDLPESLPLVAALLHLPLPEARYPALQLTPQRQRQRTLETLLALVLGLADRQPVVLVVEDLHWSDPTTLEWLGLVVDQGPTAPIFTLLTCRPTFASPWSGRTHVTLLPVPPLAAPQVTQMVQWLGEDQLSVVQRQQIVTQADGVPLFIEEVTKFVLAAQRLHGQTGWHASNSMAPEVAIPATLQDSLMARLDQLGPAKNTAQLGATIGREFPAALLQAVTPLDEDVVRQDLTQLVEAELLYQRGVGATAVYQFKHALIQEAAYASLLRRTRQHYHQHIAQVLEAQFPETVATQPELLAQHYTAAGLSEQAIAYWQRAGQHALQRSAHLEASAHLRQGLAMLTTLPETLARRQQELDLQVVLGSALMATQGYGSPDMERAYARARELCAQMGNPPQLFPVLRGVLVYCLVQGQIRTATHIGEQLLQLAQAHTDPELLLVAHYAMGLVWCYRGEPAAAQTYHRQALGIVTPQEHQPLTGRYGSDLRVSAQCHLALELWQLGYPDQALQHRQAMHTLVQAMSHAYSLVLALFYTAVLHQWRCEVRAVHEQAEALTTLTIEQGIAHWRARGTVLHGWALAMQGQNGAGIAAMRQGLATCLDMGDKLWQPYFLGLLAEAYGAGGHPDEGLEVLAEALAVMDTTEARFSEAEFYRLKGTLLLKQAVPDATQAEACFQQALTVARHQQAKAWELRAAMSLARLWQQQGKRADARELLAPIYGWFTEGFETADLQEARVLLTTLS